MANQDLVAKAFEVALNSHGFGFQHAVIEAARDLFTQHHSFWYPAIPEFPTQVQGQGTRIDIVFRHIRRAFYLVAECKRADPAVSNWCFAKAPLIPSHDQADAPFVQRIQPSPDGQATYSVQRLAHSQRVYQIGIAIRSPQRGDGQSSARQAIEDAATQVCRGLNGLISFFAERPALHNEDRYVTLLPVVFTTAHLWSSQVALSSADLNTGELHIPADSMKECDWLFYHYVQSPGITHQLATTETPSSLGDTLYTEYVRTIAIVSSAGIAQFLSSGIFH